MSERMRDRVPISIMAGMILFLALGIWLPRQIASEWTAKARGGEAGLPVMDMGPSPPTIWERLRDWLGW
jgi:hypothetical protein